MSIRCVWIPGTVIPNLMAMGKKCCSNPWDKWLGLCGEQELSNKNWELSNTNGNIPRENDDHEVFLMTRTSQTKLFWNENCTGWSIIYTARDMEVFLEGESRSEPTRMNGVTQLLRIESHFTSGSIWSHPSCVTYNYMTSTIYVQIHWCVCIIVCVYIYIRIVFLYLIWNWFL